MDEFMFATGIECSYPTVEHGTWRIDQLEETGHYKYWKRDLELVRELGLKYLRYGPPLHKMFLGPGKYDWSFMDEVSSCMQDLGIVPIADLCHFGVPDWIENFQNTDFARYFAEYSSEFARRYPWIKMYTPVNEMFVCARMSTLYGVWNEQLQTEQAFVTATLNLATASKLSMQAIAQATPDAIFVNSESSEFTQACCPDEAIQAMADFENQRRFIALDLLYGVEMRNDVKKYLFDHGVTQEDYDWFMRTDVSRRAILGVDYYEWNEKLVDENKNVLALGELFGWYVITSQYYDRYRRPVMHTETNCPNAEHAPAWLWRQWHNVQLIRHNGVPVVGFTWYSLQDQVDWDIGLRAPLGNVYPVGLFDLNRDPRLAAQAYRQLLELYDGKVDTMNVRLPEARSA